MLVLLFIFWKFNCKYFFYIFIMFYASFRLHFVQEYQFMNDLIYRRFQAHF